MGWGEMPECTAEPSREALLARIDRLQAALDDASDRTVRLQAHVARHCSLDSVTCARLAEETR